MAGRSAAAAVALGLACAGGAPSLAQAPGAAAAACAGLQDARPFAYRNPRWGFAMTYPASFALDPDSVPAEGDSARFVTADRRATAMISALRNGPGQSLAELLREARADILENSRGTITYERTRDDWFVLSGYVAGRIFYRRTLLAQGGRVIATLWIEFPRELRPCLEEAVTTMSLSFRALPEAAAGGP